MSVDPDSDSKLPVKGVLLKGSCHCGAVKFTVRSSTPVPYQLCFCSICRKVGGVGGSINLGGYYETLNLDENSEEFISKYSPVLDRGTPEERIATSERNFCSKCSAMLWLHDPTWPDLVHPFASAIDSPLQVPKKLVCVKMVDKPEYVRLPDGAKEVYANYGQFSLEDWHKKNNLFVDYAE
ncbi:Mss4-like protein [Mycena maculata]|uniref:Mss4-like protein n=1 Tax=Mycena maculata TaxID=230809 RepID=A0AAD7HHF7_9AGAR|nr:Mss4-like protein [Mycena maculata]